MALNIHLPSVCDLYGAQCAVGTVQSLYAPSDDIGTVSIIIWCIDLNVITEPAWNGDKLIWTPN